MAALGPPPARGSPPRTPRYLLELVISDGHDLRQLILYMHAMMMQHLAFRQLQLLK